MEKKAATAEAKISQTKFLTSLRSNIYLSPVYVKRSNRKSFINKESCTQTSKTIIELARMEVMTPDSLNSPTTPRLLKAEKEYENQTNLFSEISQVRTARTFLSIHDNLIENKKDTTTTTGETIFTTLNKHCNESGDDQTEKNYTIYYPQHNQVKSDNNYKCLSDENLTKFESASKYLEQSDSQSESDVFSIPENRTASNKTEHVEIMHAQVLNKNQPQKKLTLQTPILVNIISNQAQPPNSLISEFLTRKSNCGNTPFYREIDDINLEKINTKNFKSQSFVEGTSRKIYNSPKNQHMYRVGDSKYFPQSKKQGGSFMSPTLSSEQKRRGFCSVNKHLRQRPYDEYGETGVKEQSEIGSNYSLSSILGSTYPNSEAGFFLILGNVKSADWNVSLKGLIEIVDLSHNGDPEILLPYMTVINQKLLELLRSPRSHVCRISCQIAGHLFETVKDTRRPEFDDIVEVLFCKTADANKFIRNDANLALDSMVTHIPTFHAVRAICAKAPSHRNPLVRCASIRLLICAIVMAGPHTILHNAQEHTRKRVIINLVAFLEDRNLETRKYAERLYKILLKEGNLELYIKRYLDRNKLESFTRTLNNAKRIMR